MTHKIMLILLLPFVLFTKIGASVKDTCVVTGAGTSEQFINATITLKILLVEFADVKRRTSPSSYTKIDFENMLTSSGIYVSPNIYSPDGDEAYGSMRDYFQKMSSGNLTVTGFVVNTVGLGNVPNWVLLSPTKTKQQYHRLNGFWEDAITAATVQGLDVSTPPTVKLVIIYAGNTYFGPTGGWGLNPAVYIDSYIMSERQGRPYSQENSNDKFSRIGIHCHEFAHVLGIGHSSGSRADLMQAGSRNGSIDGNAPAPLNPAHRARKGWVTPTVITGQQQFDAYYSLTAPQVFRINSNTNNDYFLFENRRFNQNMVIGSTTVPDYNNSAFFPPAWSHGSISQGIFVWRVRGGTPNDYSNNGLVYASGNYGATCPEGTPSETDDGVPFPGNCNVRVLSPWSDSRAPSPNTPPSSGIFVPNTKDGSNVGIEVLSENSVAGCFTIMLYQTRPEDSSPSKPQNFRVGTHSTGDNSFPKLTWAAASEPDVNPSGKFRIWRAMIDYIGQVGLWLLKDSVAGNVTQYIDWSVYGAGSGNYIARYKIKAVDTQNKESLFSDSVSIIYRYLDKFGREDQSPTPEGINEFKLHKNYPNPFNPTTVISYQLPAVSHVKLSVYDVLGREVATLVDGMKEAGFYTANFDGSKLSSGVYFYKLQAGSWKPIKKMLLAK
ncbi:MAG: T9SS type A sorting domain-containing protein [Bacteroidota bacterium]|nr:T9SS type A sorting domain-containing protein [Bacteroidota bacterium]